MNKTLLLHKKCQLLKTFCLLYLLFLLYCCFLVPFTSTLDVQQSFNNTKQFTIAYTVAGITLASTAFFTNVIMCVVLVKNADNNGPLDFLLAMMALSDAVQPLFHFPLDVAIHWILLYGNSSNTSNLDVRTALKYTYCLQSTFARISILCVATTSGFRVYHKIFKVRNKTVSRSVKLMSLLLILCTSAGFTLFQFNVYNRTWRLKYDGISTLYGPLTVTVLSAYVAYCFTERSTHDVILRGRRLVFYSLVISYVVCWLPWYTIQLFHEFCCFMPFYGELDHDRTNHITSSFVQLKCCMNLFIMLAFDNEFKSNALKLLQGGCNCTKCCCRGHCSTQSHSDHPQYELTNLSTNSLRVLVPLAQDSGDYIMDWLQATELNGDCNDIRGSDEQAELNSNASESEKAHHDIIIEDVGEKSDLQLLTYKL